MGLVNAELSDATTRTALQPIGIGEEFDCENERGGGVNFGEALSDEAAGVAS